MDKRSKVDVICQHSSDGNIMPLKIRFEDEDGQWQTYIIKEYKDIAHPLNSEARKLLHSTILDAYEKHKANEENK